MNETQQLVNAITEGIQDKKGKNIVVADLTNIGDTICRGRVEKRRVGVNGLHGHHRTCFLAANTRLLRHRTLMGRRTTDFSSRH